MPAAHGVGTLAPGTQKNPGWHRSEPVMVTAGKMDCETLTVYEPMPPLVAAPNAVMVVPAVTPDPEMAMPTTSAPDVTAVTVSVVPVIEPVTTGVVELVMGTPEATVDSALNAYVPAPPTPERKAVTVELTVTPLPVSTEPTTSVPVTVPAVSVVPAMVPEKLAVGKEGATLSPAGQ